MGAGKIRHVIESIGFSSQAAPQTPPRTPQTPQEASQEGLAKFVFLNSPGGSGGGPVGLLGGLGASLA